MMDPARLDQAVAFDPPNETDDGYGGVEPGWGTAYECPAHYKHLRHGEAIQQSRLAGREVVVVTIRRNPTSETIDPSWRMRDRRTGKVFNIRGVERLNDRRWLEVLVEGGEVS